ncbi:hypothetical protein JHK86_018226 [Glycine max]|nr:hypothetical protein JHK86_018226 [Glycine max]
MEFDNPSYVEDASLTVPEENNISNQTLPISVNGRIEPHHQGGGESSVKDQIKFGNNVFEAKKMMEEELVEVKDGDTKINQYYLRNIRLEDEVLQGLHTMRQEFDSSMVIASQNKRESLDDFVIFLVKEAQARRNRKRDLIDRIIDIPEEIEPELGFECCIYKVPTSLLNVQEEAYTPLLISIGPIHHNKKGLNEMQEQKRKYFRFFWNRLENKLDLENYIGFLEQHEQNIRACYQKKFSDISKEEFVEMMLLDAVFIMELFLREEKRLEHKKDYLVTQRCVSKSIQRDLMLLENQLPIVMLEKLYDRVVPKNVKKHKKFIHLAHEYFRFYYPHQHSSENKFELRKWEKSLHFTDLTRNVYLPKKLRSQMKYSQQECVLRTATKLNEAGISFEKVHDRCLLDVKFEKKRFFSWFPCFGCLPCCKLFKARFQIPELRVDHTTECVLRNLIAFEQCHYPEEPYICNYVSLIDSLIHTKDDAEFLVEKEAIVHGLGSDQELANLVNGLCKNVVINSTCYHQIMEDVNGHYNNNWKWAMGTLRWVYFRDPWRSSSTIVGIAILVFTVFNFYRVTDIIFS